MTPTTPPTSTQVRINTHVTSSTTQTFSFSVGNMLLRFWVTVLLGHTKIHKVNHVLPVGTSSNQEIVRLNISVNQVTIVDRLHSGNHLLRHHGRRLDGEFAST